MKIIKYLKRDCPRISVDAPVAQLYQKLDCGTCLIIVGQQGEVLGTISSADLCVLNSGDIRSFLVTKPSLSPEDELEDALVSMAIFGTDCLPVYRGSEFLGVIHQFAIALGLVNKVTADRKVFRDVIHDLRTSIHNISGLNTLLSETVRKPEHVELLGLCSSAASHSMEILQDLLLDGVTEEPNTAFEQLDVPVFVRQCAEEMKGRAYAKGIDLLYEVTEMRFSYRFHPTKFKRSIQNLLSNAIKFTNSGGVVTVIVEIAESSCVIEIRDTGIGIPEEHQPYLLDMGSSLSIKGTDGEHSTGLGLPYVKNCLKQLNAEISITSLEGEGTSFYITLSS